MENIEKKVKVIKEQIEKLPAGSITKKNIKGKVYYYHRYTISGIRKEKFVAFEDVATMQRDIEYRKELIKELELLERQRSNEGIFDIEESFKTNIKVGKSLIDFANPVKKYKKRDKYNELLNYVYGDVNDRVFILYGLRRTGKTTMIRQVIGDMSNNDLGKTAFIQITSKNSLAEINADLKILEKKHYKYIFIDEITLAEDFIEGAAILSDVFATSGMKIVLSGTDSLGFMFSEDEQLYDRAIMLHTTYISYKEFSTILGIQGIDEYIKYGGTMSMSGLNYNKDSTFISKKSTDEYVNTAIARNIQHSLKCYQYEGHFRSLFELYKRGELTNIINRVVEDINHRFALDVFIREFKSSDLSISRKNIRKDNSVLDEINIQDVTDKLKKLLSIKDKEERTILLKENHVKEIKEYFDLLDLTCDIDVVGLDNDLTQKRVIITQPGMRYAQVDALILSLLQDSIFNGLSAEERQYVLMRIRNEVIGRMMEDIILLETKLSNPNKKVFKLQFAVGEFDMVIADENDCTCEIYEIKHSKQALKEQYRHLIDVDKCNNTEHKFGKITKKCVIYCGENCEMDSISFINVDEYLLNN